MLAENEEVLMEKCVDKIKSCRKLITKYLDEDEKIVEMEKLKTLVHDFCEIDEKFKRNEKAFEKLDNHLDGIEDPTNIDVDKLFLEILNSEPKSSSINTSHNKIWQTVFDNEGDIMIVEKKKIKQLRDNQFEEVDDSLLCSNVFTPPVDPISKAVIRNPYRNKKCKHVYEYSTITDYIQQLKYKAKCPYIGCSNNQLRGKDLVEDNQLQSHITQYLDTQLDQDSQASDSSDD